MKIDNPAFDYDNKGEKYSGYRRTDPRIASYVHQALGDAATVLNVGAGSGSYEPEHKYVVALEPSVVMRAQRKKNGKMPALIGTADKIPFDDQAFDASMAIVTIHHWPDIVKGLKEMRRVTKGPVVIMTFDPNALDEFWNARYFPELIEVERARYPQIDSITAALGGVCKIIKVPVPLDCTDGFQEAFYGRPEAFLDKNVRNSQSAWGFLPEETVSRLVKTGRWDELYGHFRKEAEFTCALRIISSVPD
jgi:SAM-dependent methyltransferase